MINNHKSVQRLTTLWAISECGLGGFFHAIQSPFTGLLVGGMAVIFISLIAKIAIEGSSSGMLTNARAVSATLLQSLVFVLIVKAAVSPHSPIGAYFAVSLQAILGIIVFSLFRHFRIAALLLALLATVSSALQKILILIIVFGAPLFEAIDRFTLGVADKLQFLSIDDSFSASESLALIYIGIYALGGIFIGYFIGTIPSRLAHRENELSACVTSFQKVAVIDSDRSTKRKNRLVMLFALLLVLAFMVEYFLLSREVALVQLAKTIGILGVWHFILQPTFKAMFQKLARKGSTDFSKSIQNVQNEIPVWTSFTQHAYQCARTMRGFRISNFVLLVLYFGLHED